MYPVSIVSESNVDFFFPCSTCSTHLVPQGQIGLCLHLQCSKTRAKKISSWSCIVGGTSGICKMELQEEKEVHLPLYLLPSSCFCGPSGKAYLESLGSNISSQAFSCFSPSAINSIFYSWSAKEEDMQDGLLLGAASPLLPRKHPLSLWDGGGEQHQQCALTACLLWVQPGLGKSSCTDKDR